MPTLTLIEPRPVADALASTESAGHWGMHTGDPLDHTASAALAFDARDPSDAGSIRRRERKRHVSEMCTTYLWRGVAIGVGLGAVFAGTVIGVVRGLLA